MQSKTSHSQEEDILLLQQLKQGKEEAWKEIFDRHHTSLYYIAFHLLKDSADAKDAVQEVFISLWARREKLMIKTSLRPYLEKAIKFHCFDKLEAQKTYQKNLDGFEYLQKDTFAPIQYENEREIQLKEMGIALQRFCHHPGYDLVQLKLEGKNSLQIANEKGISPGLARKQLSTIYGMVRRFLNVKK